MPVRPLVRPLARPVGGRGFVAPDAGGGGLPASIAEWAFGGSWMDLDLQNNLAAFNGYSAGTALAQLTLTRTTVGMAQSLSGLWSSFSSGQFRQTDKGLLLEDTRTNNLLQCRDMTNAAWVKGATITVAQTQVGIDGAANSATLVTGGAVSATNMVLQTITLGSAADTYSVFLKRVTGSGVVNISADGSTWTPVTLTTAYQQFQIQQTLANPVCGIQIITNGDQVAADFSQLETGAFATSPIPTTGATVTRNADIVQLSGQIATNATLSASLYLQTVGNEGITTNPRLYDLQTPSISVTNATQTSPLDGASGVTATIGGGGTFAANIVKAAFGLDNTSMTAIANGGTKVTQTTSAWATNAVGRTPYIGNRSGGDKAFNGYIQRVAFGYSKGVFDTLTGP